MSALITIAALVLLGLWATASYARLLRIRREVRRRWREANQLRTWQDELLKSPGKSDELHGGRQNASRAFEGARHRYNEIAAAYNKAISMPPAWVIAALAGFKRADLIGPEPDVDTPRTMRPPPADR